MWKCKHCLEQLEDNFVCCWNCGYNYDGSPPDVNPFHIIAEEDEKQKYLEEKRNRIAEAKANQEMYGSINAAMMCPHCQAKGQIRTKNITQKKGISGGKVVASVFTGGYPYF